MAAGIPTDCLEYTTARSKVEIAVNVHIPFKISTFFGVIPYTLANEYELFEESYCFHLQG
jgi:hypothetical protein